MELEKEIERLKGELSSLRLETSFLEGELKREIKLVNLKIVGFYSEKAGKVTLSANEIFVVDKKKGIKINLYIDKRKGGGMITLLDRAGKDMLELVAIEKEGGKLFVFDSKGEPQVGLFVNAVGEGQVVAAGPEYGKLKLVADNKEGNEKTPDTREKNQSD